MVFDLLACQLTLAEGSGSSKIVEVIEARELLWEVSEGPDEELAGDARAVALMASSLGSLGRDL